MEKEEKAELMRRRRAQRSLDRILDTIGPFLPKPTPEEPERPRRWRLADGATKVERVCDNEDDVQEPE